MTSKKAASRQSREEVPKPAGQLPDHIFSPEIVYAVITAVVGFLLYANSILNLYVLDDSIFITGNPFVMKKIMGIPDLFTVDALRFTNHNLAEFRPLPLLTFAVENQFFPGNPHVGHFDNVLLYALTGFFLCLLLMRIFHHYHPVFAFVVALVFVAHPLHTEVVANIKSRDEMLSFFNLVIAIFLLLRSFPAPIGTDRSLRTSYVRLALSCFFFYLALISKETAMAGLALIPLILFFDGRLSYRQIAVAFIPFLIVFLLFQFQKYMVAGADEGLWMTDRVNNPYPPGLRLPTMFLLFLRSLKLIFIPYPLAYNYLFNQIPAADWSSGGAIAGMAAGVVLLYTGIKNISGKRPLNGCTTNLTQLTPKPPEGGLNSPALRVFKPPSGGLGVKPGGKLSDLSYTPLNLGILILGIALTPAMGYVLMKGGILAERMLYAPVLGFSIVLVWLLMRIAKVPLRSADITLATMTQKQKLICAAPLIVILLLYSIDTISRNEIWHDNMSLFAHDVVLVPRSCQAHLHYAHELVHQAGAEKDPSAKYDQINNAMSQLNDAISINPHFADALYEMGRVYQYFRGNDDSAILYYNHALAEGPDYALPYFALGTVYENAGKLQMASYYYNKGVDLNPYSTEGIARRDDLRRRTGVDVRVFPSEHDIDTMEINTPEGNKDFAFYNKMGALYGKKGDLPNAQRCLEKAVGLDSVSPEALVNLSVCYGMQGNYAKTIEVLNRLLAIHPRDIQALRNLCSAYEYTGNTVMADQCRKRINALTGSK